MGKKIDLIKDSSYKGIQCPVLRSIVSSGTSFTPTKDMIVTLGANVSITVDGESIDKLQESTFILLAGVEYRFSDDIKLMIS